MVWLSKVRLVGGRGQGGSKGMPGNRFEGLWSRLSLSGKGQSQGEQNEGDPDHETPVGNRIR